MGFQSTDDEEVDVAVDELSTVSCSICLEAVSDNGDRSWAKLLCGHQFHLDCIGSAFNVKGAMKCPNCRKVEKGQWLYANGGCPFPEFSVDDWAQEEDLYGFRYSEMSVGTHWCPFNGLTRLPTPFNDGDFALNAYHDLLGQHPISMEHASVSSGSHPCPYVAYVSPLNPSSSNLGTSVSNGSSFSGHWIAYDSSNSYALPSMDVHYHTWEHASPHINATSNQSGRVEQISMPSVNQRYSRPNADIPRSAPFLQPTQVGHSSGARAESLASSSMTPYPGSNVRARDRVQALQAYYQRPNTVLSVPSHAPIENASSRRVSHRGPPSHQHQPNGFQYLPPSTSSSNRNYMETENLMPRGFQLWERDQTPSYPSNQIETEPTWEPSLHHPGVSDTGVVRFTGYRQQHASERASSHNRS